jgi:hydroxyacylglutathione hydrolase
MSSGFRILTIPLFSDNYAYAVVDTQTHECAVVDPAEPDKIVKALEDHVSLLSPVCSRHHLFIERNYD